MSFRRAALISGALAAVALGNFAEAAVLDFGQGVPHLPICTGGGGGVGPTALCANGLLIQQTYGDEPGALDVTYSAPLASTATNPVGLTWWSSAYNNLYGVLFSTGSDASSLARIELRLLQQGQLINLSHFDLGAFPNTSRTTNVTITDLTNGAVLRTFSNIAVGTASPNAATAFNFTDVTSTTGLRIEFSNTALNVGIDNITYNVVAVPEPETYALMLAGLGLVGYVAHRRKRIQRP